MLTEKCVKLNEVETSYNLAALVVFKLIYEGRAKLLLATKEDAKLYEDAYHNLDAVIKAHPEQFPTGSENGDNFQSLGLKMIDLGEKFLFPNENDINMNEVKKLPL